MGGSWLSGGARRHEVRRQRERTQVDGRRIAAAAQAMVEHQQSGLAQTLAELTEVLLQHERLAGAGIGFCSALNLRSAARAVALISWALALA